MFTGRIKILYSMVSKWITLERKQGHFAYYPPLAKMDLQLTQEQSQETAEWPGTCADGNHLNLNKL